MDKMKITNYMEIIKEVEKYVESKCKGDFIEHEEIEKICGFSCETAKYTYLMARVKDELINKGIVLRSLVGYGYKILLENEIAEEVYDRYIISAKRKMEVATKILSNTNTDLLDAQELREFDAINLSVSSIRQNVATEIANINYTLRQRKMKLLNQAIVD